MCESIKIYVARGPNAAFGLGEIWLFFKKISTSIISKFVAMKSQIVETLFLKAIK